MLYLRCDVVYNASTCFYYTFTNLSRFTSRAPSWSTFLQVGRFPIGHCCVVSLHGKTLHPLVFFRPPPPGLPGYCVPRAYQSFLTPLRDPNLWFLSPSFGVGTSTRTTQVRYNSSMAIWRHKVYIVIYVLMIFNFENIFMLILIVYNTDVL